MYSVLPELVVELVLPESAVSCLDRTSRRNSVRLMWLIFNERKVEVAVEASLSSEFPVCRLTCANL